MLTAMSNKITKNIISMIKTIGEVDDESEDDETTTDSDGEEKKESEEDIKARKAKKDEEYLDFWHEYGKNIKLGIMED